MPATQTVRYLKTLNRWLKADDKALREALTGGQTVYEISESLEREPLAVLNRLDELEICPAEQFSEEWAELLSLTLAEVPLGFAVSWCTAAEDRLPYEMFRSFATRDLSLAFELAREYRINVPTADAVDALAWLADQPEDFRRGYAAACEALIEAFEVITPATLKNQCLGIKAPPLVRNWAASTSASTPKAAAKRSKTWSRRPKTTTRTFYARKRPARQRKAAPTFW